MKLKHTDSPVKKKRFHAQLSVKKIILTVFWDIKRSITIDFLEKGASCSQHLKQNSSYLYYYWLFIYILFTIYILLYYSLFIYYLLLFIYYSLLFIYILFTIYIWLYDLLA